MSFIGRFWLPPRRAARDTVGDNRQNVIQHFRTARPDNPPPNNLLLDGELAIEQATPMRVWVGVQPGLDPTGRKLLFDASLIDGSLDGKYLPLVGGTLTGALHIESATDAKLYIKGTGSDWPGIVWDGPTGTANFFQSQRNGLRRWTVEFGGSDAETGNDAGTSFLINRFSDTGAVLSPSPLRIARASGMVTLAAGATLGFDPTAPMHAATKQYVDTKITTDLGAYLPLAGGTMSGGISFGSALAPGGALDNSRHIAIYPGYGINTTAARFNFNAPTGAQYVWANGALAMLRLNTGGLFSGGPVTLPGDPTAPLHATPKQYVDAADALLQREIDVLSEDMFFAGGLNVVTDVGHYTIASGLIDGSPLPAPSQVYKGFYVIVTQGGQSSTAGNIPPADYALADWIACDGNQWIRLPLGQADLIASQVAITPPVGLLGPNVQTGLTWLDAQKLSLSGGTMQGMLTLFALPVQAMDATPKQYVDNLTGNYLPLTGGTVSGITTFRAQLNVYGMLTVGDNTGTTTSVQLNAATGKSRYVIFRTASVTRWAIGANPNPESTGNVGSDFGLYRYADDGTYVSAPLIFNRSTGLGTLSGDPTANLGIATKQYVDGKVAGVPIGNYLPLTGGTVTGTTYFNGAGNGIDVANTSLLRNSLTIGTNATGAVGITINAIASSGRRISWQSVGVLRWSIGGAGGNENGSDTGTDFVFIRYNDAGVAQPVNPIAINRASGRVSIGTGMNFIGGIASATTDFTKHIALYGATFGLNVTGARLNIVCGGAGTDSIYLMSSSLEIAQFSSGTGLTMKRGAVTLFAPPTAAMHATTKQYVDAADALLQQEIDVLAADMFFAGGINVVTDVGHYTIASGLTDGTPLPAPEEALKGFYVIVTQAGVPPVGNIPPGTYFLADWIACDGVQWIQLPIGQAESIASNVAIVPPIGALGPNVQTGLQWLDTNKFDKTGGTVTGVTAFTASGTALDVLNSARVQASLTIGLPTTNSLLQMNGAIASLRRIMWYSAGTSRWSLGMSGLVEGGNNTGASMQITRFSDTGTSLGVALDISRADGLATVAGDPTAALGVATKQYVDSKVAGIPVGNYLPLAGGVMTGGISFGTMMGGSSSDLSKHISLHAGGYGFGVTAARLNYNAGSTGIHAFLIAGAEVARFDATGLIMWGSTHTITLSVDPTAPMHAVTKRYIDLGFTPLTLQNGGTVDYNTIPTGLALRQYGGPVVTSNGPTGGTTDKGTVLTSYSANAGWAGQLFMGATGTPDTTPLYFRVTSSAPTGWSRWNKVITDNGGNFINAIGFTSAAVLTPNDLSKHIKLYAATFGFSITANRLNIVSASSTYFFNGGVDVLSVSGTSGVIMQNAKALTLAIDPVAPMHATPKQYVDAADDLLRQEIAVLAEDLFFVGGINVVTDVGHYTIASGLEQGSPLPAPAEPYKGFFVIVTQGGTSLPGGNIPPDTYELADWIVCDGAQWIRLPIGQANMIAANVMIAPPIGALGANVQTGLEWLNTNKLDITTADATYLPFSGGMLTDFLSLHANPTAVMHATPKQYVDDQIATAISGVNTSLGNYLPLTGGTVTGTTYFNAQTGGGLNVLYNARIQGGLFLGMPGTTGGSISIDGTATAARRIYWYSGGSTRWSFGPNGVAEAGANAGTDLTLYRFDDAGVALGALVQFSRSTGQARFNNGIATTGGFAVSVTNLARHLDFYAGTYGINMTSGPARINHNAPAGASHVMLIGGGDVFTVSGAGVTVGNVTEVNKSIYHIGATGSNRRIYWQTDTRLRWGMGTNSGAETGTDVGSDFQILRYADAGNVLLSIPLTITRKTGLVSINNGASFGSATSATPQDLSKHIALFGTTFGISITGGRVNILTGGPTNSIYLLGGTQEFAQFTNTGMTLKVGAVTLLANPTANLHAAPKQYVDAGDAALQTQIDVLAEDMFFCGGLNVVTDVGNYTIASGLVDGTALPAPATALKGFYVIVTQGGQSKAGNIPSAVYALADWIACDGIQWIRLPLGQANVIASQVAITPAIGSLGANVQTGLDWLNRNKLDLTGGTLTGQLRINTPPGTGYGLDIYTGNSILARGNMTGWTGLALGQDNVNQGGITQNAGPGFYRRHQWNTNNIPRWTQDIYGNETGGDAGAAWNLTRFSDTGVNLGTVISFSRVDGLATIAGDPKVPLGIATKQYVDARELGGGGAYLPLAGGTLTGFLTLHAPPTAALHAATKAYVDQVAAGGTEAFLPLAGGTMTGFLTLNADPTAVAHAATKRYVDAADAVMQAEIDVLSNDMFFAGGIAVPTDVGHFTIASGIPDGESLPAPSEPLKGYYVIVTQGGVPPAASQMPQATYALADWIACDGVQWIRLPIGQADAIASNVAISPAIGSLGPDVQSGLTWLNANKVNKAGDTMTGGLGFGSVVAAAPNNLTRHLMLWGNNFGASVTSNRLNLVAGTGSVVIMSGPTDIATFGGAGMTLNTGALTLKADPTGNLHAATKQYVDAQVAAGGAFLPLSGGTLTGDLTITAAKYLNFQSTTTNTAQMHSDANWGLLIQGYAGGQADLALMGRAGPAQFKILSTGNVWINGVITDTAGTVTLLNDPTADLHAVPKRYVDSADALLQREIDVLSEDMFFAGGLNVVTDVGHYTIASGLTDGGPLPAPSETLKGFYVIVTQPGVAKAGNIPAGTYALADWIACDGVGWIQLPLGQANIIAAQVAITPAIGSLGANVQTGLQWLDTNKLNSTTASATYLPLAGGTMTGGLAFGSRLGASNSDITKHISLHANGFGFGITSNRLNYNVTAGGSHVFLTGTTDYVTISTQGLVINRGAAGWSGHNYGKGLLVYGQGSNTAIGIFDNAGANPIALANSGAGKLIIAKMPVLTDATTLPTIIATFDIAGSLINTGGLGFANAIAASPTDLSKHLRVYATSYGLSVTSATLNIVAGGNIAIYPSGTARVAVFNAGGLTIDAGKPVTLGQDPTAPLHAATKQYVDSRVASVPVANYLPLAGGTLTGFLTLHANPTAALHAVTKQYVDAAITGGTGAYLPLSGGTLTGPLNMTPHALTVGTITCTSDITATQASYAGWGTSGRIGLYGLDGFSMIYFEPSNTWALHFNVTTGELNWFNWENTSYLKIGGTGQVTVPFDLTIGGNVTGYDFWCGNAYRLSLSGGYFYSTADYTILLQDASNWQWRYTRATGAMEWVRGSDGVALLTIDGGGNAYVPVSMTSGYIHSTGAFMCDSGVFYVANNTNYYLARNINDGAWRFVEGGTVNLTIEATGNAVVRNALTVQGARIITYGVNNNASVTVWNQGAGYAAGIWCYDAGRLNFGSMTGAGEVSVAHGFLTASSLVFHGGTIQLQVWASGYNFCWGDNGGFNVPAMAYKPGGGPWATVSDIRTKTVLGDYDRGLAAICALRPVRYKHKDNWRRSGDEAEAKIGPHAMSVEMDTTFVGLVAQEAEIEMPEMVGVIDADVDGVAVNDLRTLDMTALPLALVNAVKELVAMNEALSARVAALETRTLH